MLNLREGRLGVSMEFMLLIFFCLIVIGIENQRVDTKLSTKIKFQSLNKSDEVLDLLSVIRRNKLGKCTIICISNYGFKEFTLNWILSLERNNYTKFVVISFDIELVNYLSELGYSDRTAVVPSKWLGSNITKTTAEFSKLEYNLITQAKVQIHYNLLLNNVTFLMSDADIVWLSPFVKELIEFNLENSYAHMAISQDVNKGIMNYNTGFMYITPTKFTIELLNKWIQEQKKNVNKSIDQFVFNRLLSKIRHNDNRILPLDKLLFACGKAYFHTKTNQRFNIKPFIVHPNSIVGVNKKINYLRSSGFWYL
jgi:hypothetical protein